MSAYFFIYFSPCREGYNGRANERINRRRYDHFYTISMAILLWLWLLWLWLLSVVTYVAQQVQNAHATEARQGFQRAPQAVVAQAELLQRPAELRDRPEVPPDAVVREVERGEACERRRRVQGPCELVAPQAHVRQRRQEGKSGQRAGEPRVHGPELLEAP